MANCRYDNLTTELMRDVCGREQKSCKLMRYNARITECFDGWNYKKNNWFVPAGVCNVYGNCKNVYCYEGKGKPSTCPTGKYV